MKNEMTKKQRTRVESMDKKGWDFYRMSNPCFSGNAIMHRKTGYYVSYYEVIEIDRKGTKADHYFI